MVRYLPTRILAAQVDRVPFSEMSGRIRSVPGRAWDIIERHPVEAAVIGVLFLIVTLVGTRVRRS
jgi:hypothetical protein